MKTNKNIYKNTSIEIKVIVNFRVKLKLEFKILRELTLFNKLQV